MRNHLPKHQYEIRVFSRMRFFVPKNPNVMGFSGSVNGTTNNPGFLDFGFCQCKWAYSELDLWALTKSKCHGWWGKIMAKVWEVKSGMKLPKILHEC